VKLTVDAGALAATVDPRFLSVAVDTAQVVGGLFWDPAGSASLVGSVRVPVYDFSRPRLRKLAAALAPFYLRIGGSTADDVYYDLGDEPTTEPPEGYEWVLTRAMVDAVIDFARELGAEVLFTLNAGPGPRDEDLVWQADNARELVRYVAGLADTPLTIWELGNEPNGYLLLHQMLVTEAIYAADVQAARQLLADEHPGARLAAPSCAFWPKVGDFTDFYAGFMPLGGAQLDLVTWHYYPQQSIRCQLRTRPASPETAVAPQTLAEVDSWADKIDELQASHAPQAEVWLGETGNAQCGGEPGVSDAFAGSLWWLDQLGRMARRGHKVVVRQTLSGSNYGLLDDETLDPTPDFWASVLHKRLLGARVLDVGFTFSGTAAADERLGVYAHCTAAAADASAGAVSLLLLNLDLEHPLRVQLGDALRGARTVYQVTATGLEATEVSLNGTALAAAADGSLPQLTGEPRHGEAIDLPPASYAFVVIDAPAFGLCR